MVINKLSNYGVINLDVVLSDIYGYESFFSHLKVLSIIEAVLQERKLPLFRMLHSEDLGQNHLKKEVHETEGYILLFNKEKKKNAYSDGGHHRCIANYVLGKKLSFVKVENSAAELPLAIHPLNDCQIFYDEGKDFENSLFCDSKLIDVRNLEKYASLFAFMKKEEYVSVETFKSAYKSLKISGVSCRTSS